MPTKLQAKAQRAMVRATLATPQAIDVRRAELLEQRAGDSAIATRKHRSLRLVAVLLEHRAGLTREQLESKLGVPKPTLYRLRDDLIAAGLPLVVRERAGVGVWSLDVW